MFKIYNLLLSQKYLGIASKVDVLQFLFFYIFLPYNATKFVVS